MDVSPEQKRLWAQEVRYLHSLWRNAALHCSSADPIPGENLKKNNSTSTNPNKKHKKKNSTSTNPPPSVVDDNPWEAWPRSPPRPNAWGDFPSPPSPPPRPPPSATDQAKAAVARARAHHTALQTCEAFFSIDPAEDAEYSEMDEDDEYESNVFNFFLGIFEGNDQLRGYYKKNGERGEFICLVCAATGAKVGRQYADCVSLVQHANAICKTKRPLAHRALANVVCRVLGWDITRLPSIVLDATEQKDDLLRIKEKEEINGETGNNAGHMSRISDSPNNDAAFSENKQSSRVIGDYVEIDDDSDDGEVDWELVSKEIAFDENKQISRDIGEHIDDDDDDDDDDDGDDDDDDGVVDWDLVTKALASQDANNGE